MNCALHGCAIIAVEIMIIFNLLQMDDPCCVSKRRIENALKNLVMETEYLEWKILEAESVAFCLSNILMELVNLYRRLFLTFYVRLNAVDSISLTTIGHAVIPAPKWLSPYLEDNFFDECALISAVADLGEQKAQSECFERTKREFKHPYNSLRTPPLRIDHFENKEIPPPLTK